MNLCHNMPLCFFTIVIFHTIQVALSQYEPLYFFKLDEYQFVYNIIYNASTKHYVAQAPGKHIRVLVACPSLDENSDFFEVQKIERDEATVLPLCKKPIESRVFQAQLNGEDIKSLKTIGYSIQEPSNHLSDEISKENTDNSAENRVEEKSDHSPENTDHPISKKTLDDTSNDLSENDESYEDEPPTYNNLELIVFKLDKTLNRIKFVWHTVASGKLLKPGISRKRNNPYQTNQDIYGYDVDHLYSQSSGTYVKVQLAPEEDFLFENWKSASRHNILTAPMRRDLLPQWQQLEIFIRKVTQIIDAVSVTTGIHGTLTQLDLESQQKTISYEYLHDGKYPIPSLFWKTVVIEFFHDDTLQRRGILFVMHNVDPSADHQIKKICPDDDLSQTGWQFPADDKFKNLMYPCLLNEESMEILEEDTWSPNCQPFNLYKMPSIRIGEDGNEVYETINVIEKINQNGILNTAFRYFINAFSYPLQFLLSYYNKKND